MGDESVQRILGYARRVAVVGLSDRPSRPSYGVATALRQRGYEIVPVNPNLDGWEGLTSYASLADVPDDIDLVDVFRREEHLPAIAGAAVDTGAKGLWIQLGLHSTEAQETARAAQLDYVEDRCLKVEVERHASELDLPPR